MSKDVKAELNKLAKAIQNGKDLSYGELVFLQDHQKEIYELGDIVLAEWAGIPESEWQLAETDIIIEALKEYEKNNCENKGAVWQAKVDELIKWYENNKSLRS